MNEHFDYADPNRIAFIQNLPLPPRLIWRFLLIERAGGEKLPHLERLSPRERVAILFNPFTFFFGVFHLMVAGLWRQALWWFVLSIALSIPLSMVQNSILPFGVSLAVSGIMSSFSYRWMYRKHVLQAWEKR